MSIIKCDLDPKEFLVWKYQEENPAFGSQVIVSQTQQVILLASGKLVSILDPGAHTLETANIPVLKDYIKDNEEAFPFEIWFLNKIKFTEFKWGTRTPISCFDPISQLPINVGSYGSYKAQINDVQSFLLNIVGVRHEFSLASLKEFLMPHVERDTKSEIAQAVAKQGKVFGLVAEAKNISEKIKINLNETFKSYGLILGDFYIQDISPLEDEQLKMYKNAIAEGAKIRVTGKAIEDTESGYRAERTYNTLDKLAANEGGSSSAFTGAGIGLGAGLGLGNKFMDMTNKNMNTTNPEKKSINKTPAERIIALNELLQNNLISQEEFDSKKKKIIDEL
tara:strand:- start:46 stop:1053 length:1008 start_codon:yes stop_codon:yes gene_type:complete